MVSHAGVGLLREMAEETGLVDAVTAALADTYQGPCLHAPGRVFTDLAVAVADGADAISGIGVLGDRQDLFGAVASMPTAWRVLDKVDQAHLGEVRAARAQARVAAWSAGAGPDLAGELCVDFDATITIALGQGAGPAYLQGPRPTHSGPWKPRPPETGVSHGRVVDGLVLARPYSDYGLRNQRWGAGYGQGLLDDDGSPA